MFGYEQILQDAHEVPEDVDFYKNIIKNCNQNEDDKWYVCYQNEGQNMTWTNHKDEEEARAMYESHLYKQAKILSHKDNVFEKDGDQKIIDVM